MRPFCRRALITAYSALLLSSYCICQTPPQTILCRQGNGNFEAEIPGAVGVHVGAAKTGGATTLARRACSARLSSQGQELLIATDVFELDLDAFGADMGGTPVATFQVKKSADDCCMDYLIYSLEQHPRLVRTITGGQFFNAADIDLDGKVEIWTDDAAAVNGFEKLTLGEMDFLPTVVFRFAKGKLRDVSAEFQTFFDNRIEKIRSGIQAKDVEDFKASGGQPAEILTPSTADRLRQLRSVKVKILEVVWAYLYSGREEEAWHVLSQMWPISDIDRIRTALLKVREHGIHSQADETSTGPRTGTVKRVKIFDAIRTQPAGNPEVMPPQAILLEFPATMDGKASSAPEGFLLDLIVDSAGKVHANEFSGTTKWASPEQLAAVSNWKFIPAFLDGHAVASRLRINVSPKK